MLGLAKRIGARFLLTSTSEVYGDPLQHPQVETYWGNVNPIGNNSSSFYFFCKFCNAIVPSNRSIESIIGY
jgi:nucleoside-diphosphate-sugar epimerase